MSAISFGADPPPPLKGSSVHYLTTISYKEKNRHSEGSYFLFVFFVLGPNGGALKYLPRKDFKNETCWFQFEEVLSAENLDLEDFQLYLF